MNINTIIKIKAALFAGEIVTFESEDDILYCSFKKHEPPTAWATGYTIEFNGQATLHKTFVGFKTALVRLVNKYSLTLTPPQ